MKRIRTLSLLLILCLFGFANISGQIGIANDEKPNVSQISPEVENYIMEVIPFEWIEISGIADPLPAAYPSGNNRLHTLPFPFKFYDESFTNVWISQSGYLSFSELAVQGHPWNEDFPAIHFDYMIAPFWDWLLPYQLLGTVGGIQIFTGGGSYHVKNFEDFTVVEWKNLKHFGEEFANVRVGSFQVILKESGDIIFNYDYLDYIDPDDGYTCGLNYGINNLGAYNQYDMLDSNTEHFSLLFTQPVLKNYATIDFDPDTLNRKSQGKWVTVYIDLPTGYNVEEIDTSTVMLNGEVLAEEHPTEIGDHDDNGIPDLMVKFDRAAAIDAIGEGTEVDITITGNMLDGTPFEGFTEIRALF